MTKRCSTCHKSKAADQFSKRKASPDGLHLVCKSCDCKRLAKWRRANPDAGKKWWAANPDYKERWLAAKPDYRKQQHLSYCYNLSLAAFNTMLKGQKGRCAICDKKMKKPVVDHDHSSGKIRSLLCVGCNTAIGLLKDSPKLVKVAFDYLVRHTK